MERWRSKKKKEREREKEREKKKFVINGTGRAKNVFITTRIKLTTSRSQYTWNINLEDEWEGNKYSRNDLWIKDWCISKNLNPFQFKEFVFDILMKLLSKLISILRNKWELRRKKKRKESNFASQAIIIITSKLWFLIHPKVSNRFYMRFHSKLVRIFREKKWDISQIHYLHHWWRKKKNRSNQ